MYEEQKIKNEILKSKLIIKPLSKEATDDFMESQNPIAWLVAHNHAADHESFYANLAKLLKIEYLAEIPTPINSSESIAYSIGPQKLSKLMAFPYRQKDCVTIACCEPTHAEKIIKICSEALPQKQVFCLAIAAPNTVRRAIANSEYRQSAIAAQEFLSIANPPYSSKGVLSPGMRISLALISLLAIIFFFWRPPRGFLAFFIIINIFYLIFNFIRILITLKPYKKTVSSDLPTVLKTPANNLPMYTILVPLKDEAVMVPELIRRLQDIEYPSEKLDIKLALEVTDESTIHALKQESIDDTNTFANKRHLKYHLVKVPISELSTKPRSCNYALQFARGDITVIYDAEDMPDPLQLKKAYALFLQEKLDTLCVQAKLNFYNVRQNLLTRFFSLEYSFWYDAFLPGLYTWNVPLPLGGTSNHFLTGTLNKIGNWDPYNVTEDADIGWRLSRLGYRTAMLDSYTLEEANAHVGSWIRQRTRWEKGFLLTTLVHLGSPIKMYKQLGLWGFVSSATLFMTTFMLPILNPILWIFFILWYVLPLLGMAPIGFSIPDWLHTVGLINLIVGNGAYILVHLINAIKQKHYHLIAIAPLMPFYWLLISAAGYRAIYQTIVTPHKWEKTAHGVK